MNKFKSFFGKMRNRNIVFIISFLLCVGVIAFIAFDADEIKGNVIQQNKADETSATTTWYNEGTGQSELNSDTTTSVQTSVTTAKPSSKKASKASDSKKKSNKKSTKKSKKTSTTTAKKTKANKKTTTKTTAKKTKSRKKTTVTTTKKIKKPTKKKAVTTTTKKKKVTTTAAKRIKKKTTTTSTKAKKKKTTTTTKITTRATTNATTSKKSETQSYKTRDISKETYTIKNAFNGKKIKSNGFDIVCQVVNGEVDPTWHEEAIKAQAVAAYTYLRYCKANGVTPVLGAKSGYNSRIESIVKSVEGLVITYDGSAINAVFCASTAGCTADSANVWGGYYPYLKSVDSKFDATYDPNYGVIKTLSKKEVKKILKKQGVTLGTKKKNWIKITSKYNGKYVESVSIDGQLNLTGAKIRSLFELKSTAFTVSYSNESFTFTTYGYGHGVGMSQWGAQLYASKGGYKFDQILKHYYSGVKIN